MPIRQHHNATSPVEKERASLEKILGRKRLLLANMQAGITWPDRAAMAVCYVLVELPWLIILLQKALSGGAEYEVVLCTAGISSLCLKCR